ncbi:asparagine synthase [Yoonia maricola]|uniref:Asparagine synthase n=1 Tax=Yoonia maricola TaxID=420999 RepID=A0A2M8W0E1_9RHOB|nr:asparagine synthase-related protein [Yoonia maricola]PJI84386.1 asparagine synthase [Yoonia maricola]
MSKVSLRVIPTGQAPALSQTALALYLRLGFLPAPLSVLREEAVINVFDTALCEEFSPETGDFRRDLRQFTGTRNTDQEQTFDEQEAIDSIRETLLETTARLTEGYDRIFLMISGGKDSLSVAWALKELGRNATFIHCTNRGREDESADVARVCKLLGYECIYLPDDIHDVDPYFSAHADKLAVPIADQAFFSYLRAVREISGILDADNSMRAILLDGMGNDAYMGHIPPKREKRLLSLPRLPAISENMIAPFYRHNHAHYALETLFKPRDERHFSGAGFAVHHGPLAPDLPQIFHQYADRPEERRALLRGGVFDIDCCIRKGVLATTLEDRLDIGFPFLDPAWVRLYSQWPANALFDYNTSFNKKLLRNFLKQAGILSDFASSQKGSFRFNLDQLPQIYSPSAQLCETLWAMGVGKGAISGIVKYATSGFVAAQKLGQLYVLDKFLEARDINSQLMPDSGVAMRYAG